jgi:hypothetical protein
MKRHLSNAWSPSLKMLGIGMILCLITALRCRDPRDWQPGDPQGPPPGPTEIIAPPADTGFLGPQELVRIDWRAVSGAEQYELQWDTTAKFTNPSSQLYESAPIDFLARVTTSNSTPYYMRVRAGSPAWTWWTDWSPTHMFYIFNP